MRVVITSEAPRRANSEAMALPRPVPPPVTMTATPSKVPGRRAVSPTAGGWGSPVSSVTGQLPVQVGVRSSARAARSSAMSSLRLTKVW